MASLVRSRLGNTPSDLLRRAMGVSFAVVVASLALVGQRDHHRVFSSRFECGTDPLDILRIGEILDKSSLRFIIDAHCTNARYLSDERIELRYGGEKVDVETRKLSIGGNPDYYKIVLVGGWPPE
jgi:hypothetical protein